MDKHNVRLTLRRHIDIEARLIAHLLSLKPRRHHVNVRVGELLALGLTHKPPAADVDENADPAAKPMELYVPVARPRTRPYWTLWLRGRSITNDWLRARLLAGFAAIQAPSARSNTPASGPSPGPHRDQVHRWRALPRARRLHRLEWFRPRRGTRRRRPPLCLLEPDGCPKAFAVLRVVSRLAVGSRAYPSIRMLSRRRSRLPVSAAAQTIAEILLLGLVCASSCGKGAEAVTHRRLYARVRPSVRQNCEGRDHRFVILARHMG